MVYREVAYHLQWNLFHTASALMFLVSSASGIVEFEYNTETFEHTQKAMYCNLVVSVIARHTSAPIRAKAVVGEDQEA